MKGEMSRYGLSQYLKVNTPSISKLVDSLIKDGFVKEKGFGNSIGGRRPLLLKINPRAAYVVGIDFEAGSILGTVVDLGLRTVTQKKSRINKRDKNDLLVEKISKLIQDLTKEAQINESKVIGVGIGTPGILDTEKGILIRYSERSDWWNIPLKELVGSRVNLPIYIEDNSRVMALGEKWFYFKGNIRSLICLRIKTGIGGGFIIDGNLYTGNDQRAGEIGHMVIDPEGPLCSCGNRGCLQSYASGATLIELAKKKSSSSLSTKETINLKAIAEAAAKGDKTMASLIKGASKYLGIAILNLINLFDPQEIIINGDLNPAQGILLKEIREVVQKSAIGGNSERAEKIHFSQLGEYAGALGAAIVVLQNQLGFR